MALVLPVVPCKRERSRLISCDSLVLVEDHPVHALRIVMAYMIIVCIGVAYIVTADIVTADTVMTCIVVADVAMADIGIAYMVMADTVMAL